MSEDVQTPAGGRILTEDQLAIALQLEPRTLRLWRRTRGLPHIKISQKVVRYRWSDIEQWLDRRRCAVTA